MDRHTFHFEILVFPRALDKRYKMDFYTFLFDDYRIISLETKLELSLILLKVKAAIGLREAFQENYKLGLLA